MNFVHEIQDYLKLKSMNKMDNFAAFMLGVCLGGAGCFVFMLSHLPESKYTVFCNDKEIFSMNGAVYNSNTSNGCTLKRY